MHKKIAFADIFILGFVLDCLFSFPALAAEKQKDLTYNRENDIKIIVSYVPNIETLPLDLQATALCGYYSDKPFSVDLPELSGDELYLFPDETYYYLMWADVLPLTIYDKGGWKYKNGYIELYSDHSVNQKDFPKDHRYIPLQYKGGDTTTSLLVGAEWELSYFREKVKLERETRDRLFMLDLNSFKKQQEKSITSSNYEETKKMLMEKCWHPEFFGKAKK
jgi:hypothetical protein